MSTTSSTKLRDVELLVDQLDPADQVRLYQYLSPRVAATVAPPTAPVDADVAWREFREVGRQLAATSMSGSKSLTDAVSEARR